MKLIALDDERIALEALEEAIKGAEPDAEVHCFQKAKAALEFARENPCDVAVLDIQVWDMNGIELAKQMKILRPDMNIVFATGYYDYMGVAFDLHASGYVMKPVTPEKIKKELADLRYPVDETCENRVRFQTFGNFEVFAGGEPMRFRYDKTKELLAYLVDRSGAFCPNGEIMAVLWGDSRHPSYLSNLKKDLHDRFNEAGCSDALESGWNKLRIVPEKVDCDYYDWQSGKPAALNRYRGEYMAQYSWAELTNSEINSYK